MDFPELLVILAVAFIFLGPEKMLELATKLGEFLRKARETWDDLRYQLYLESINKKIMEQEEKENGETRTSQDAPDGASEGVKKQTD